MMCINTVSIAFFVKKEKSKVKPHGFYHPLPVLDFPRVEISIDFVLGFPRTKSGYQVPKSFLENIVGVSLGLNYFSLLLVTHKLMGK